MKKKKKKKKQQEEEDEEDEDENEDEEDDDEGEEEEGEVVEVVDKHTCSPGLLGTCARNCPAIPRCTVSWMEIKRQVNNESSL